MSVHGPQIPPSREVVVRYDGDVLHCCICRDCRSHDGRFMWHYRAYKRQQRMARKRRRGWA